MSDQHHMHLRRMATVATNEDEDALLWALAEIKRLNAITDKVLAYRPKPKSKPARKRQRQKRKLVRRG